MVSIKLSENNGKAPEAVPYMPAGLNHISCTVNGRAGRRSVMADEAACERLNADLQEMIQASAAGGRARPVVLFDHKAGPAAAEQQGFEWDDKRGILLRVKWTAAGREAVEGGNYGYISPAFRLEKGGQRISGLNNGVEVGSLVNDPAFERNECIAASKAEPEDEELLDVVLAANPYGCNQYGEGWRMPHNGMQVLRKRKDAEPAPDTKALDDSRVDDDDDSPDAMSKRRERLNLHRSFAEEMKRLMAAWGSGQSEIVKAAAGTEDDKRPFPVRMPDGTMCHTYGCEKHKDADALALKEADRKLDELEAQIKQAYEKGQRTKVEKLMEEHEKMLDYAEKCNKNIQARSLHVIGEAKTREQAIKDTKSILPEHLRKKCVVEFDESMTLHEINEYNKALKGLVDKYPTPYLFRLGSTYVRNGGVLALATPTSLHVNHDKQKEGIHAVGKMHKYKYHSQAGFSREVVASNQKQQDQMKAIIAHEYGHVIFMNTKEEARNKSNPNYAAFKEATKSLRSAFKQARKNGDIKKISEYGNTNEDEFFSECLAAREMGEKLPSYINNALDNVLKTANMK